MPKEPDTTHDTETPTNDVKTPVTDDTEPPEPAKGQRRYTFLSRHISTLRALRLGGVFTVLTAIVLAIVWWVQLTLLWGITFPFFLFFPGLLPWLIGAPLLWAFGSQLETLKHTFAAITTVCIVVAVGVMGQHWWLIHEQTFNWSELFQALLISGLGVFIVSDVLLRGIRDHQNIPPGDPSDPARYRPRKHNTTSSRRWVTLLRRIALTVVPIAAAATAIALLHISTAPINHTTPPPEGPLPERSTGIGTTLAWSKEVPGLLATASGAAGPVILTPEGLTGLNPADGTTLWTYHRKNTEYAKILDQTPGEEDFPNSLLNSYLVSSPNNRYVALRVWIPGELVQNPKDTNATGTSTIRKPINNAMTVVVDTLTGHVTNEHPSHINWNLQLTDSAILDGTTAYNLDDGKVRWNLKPLTDDEPRPYSPSGYSGPAGHKSFILDRDPDEEHRRQQCMSKSLPLISDTDPTEITTAENIAVDNLTCYPVIVRGRTAQYTKALVVEKEAGETPGVVQAQETRVVTLDSLAGLEKTEPIDMGKTIGLNGAASRASGTLATYPVPEDGKAKFKHVNYSTHFEGLDWENPTVGAVFDPTTNTTVPAGQYPGLAAASVGIVPAARDETLLAEIVMKPSDGSAGASFPLDSQGILQPPEEILANRRLIPAQLSELKEGRNVNAINTPGTTLVTLKIDNLEPFHSSGRYKPTDSRLLYGLTGDIS